MTSMNNGIASSSWDQPHGVESGCCSLAFLDHHGLLPTQDVDALRRIARPRRVLRRHEALVHEGQDLSGVYLLRSGSLKQVSRKHGAAPMVTAFYMPGELVALDALAQGCYTDRVLALETSTAWEVPFGELLSLTGRMPTLRLHLYRLLSEELYRERLKLRLLLRQTSRIRLASFLLSLSQRFRRCGYSPYHFRLSMSRGDIGNYLGMSLETVSRTLAVYQRQGFIQCEGREVRLLDFEGLRALVDGDLRRRAVGE